MKRTLRILKATLIGGLLFMVPLILMLVVLRKGIEFAKKIVTPVAALAPVESVAGVTIVTLVAALLLVLIAMGFGLFAQTRLGRRIRDWLESTVVGKVPGYSILKGILADPDGVSSTADVKTALAWIEESWVYAFVLEVHPDGNLTVFVPGAPSPLAGAVYFLPEDRVRLLDVPVAPVMKALRGLGIGSAELLAGSSRAEGAALAAVAAVHPADAQHVPERLDGVAHHAHLRFRRVEPEDRHLGDREAPALREVEDLDVPGEAVDRAPAANSSRATSPRKSLKPHCVSWIPGTAKSLDDPVADLAEQDPVEGLALAHEVLLHAARADRDRMRRQPLGELDPLRERASRGRCPRSGAGRPRRRARLRGSRRPCRGWRRSEMTRRSSFSSPATRRARATVSSVEPSSTRIVSQSQPPGRACAHCATLRTQASIRLGLVVGGNDERCLHCRVDSITNW